MSCIKFPSSKHDLSKTSTKENVNDYAVANSQLIAIANQVFGHRKWSHAIMNQTLDYSDYIAGKYQAGCNSIVRVQLNDGIFHEDIGYSSTEGSSKGSAIQRARLGSFNTALKKALMCFGSEITNKINSLSSRPTSPAPTELVPNKFLPIETSTVTETNKIEAEPFAEAIPLSQTDALMDIVDLENLFVKDQKSITNSENKQIKVDVPKPFTSTSTGANILTDKERKFDSFNGAKKEVKADVPKIGTSLGVNISDKNNKLNIDNGLKKDTKVEVPKAVVSTAMTEEEMRLERKRKQREMQEEFKRKEEYKKKYAEPGSKQQLNPRY